MYRLVVIRSLFALFIIALAAIAPLSAMAGIASNEEATEEKVIGSEKAPVTMIEYASLGCHHCAAFHQDTYPKIKKEYIDTGKLRMIFRDFPLGTPALAAAMVARCSGPSRYFGFVDLLFRSQAQWSRSDDVIAELTKVARFGGMSGTDVQACLQNQYLLNSIQAGAKKAQEEHKIRSTPSFVIGDETIPGAADFEEFSRIIEKALKEAQ